MSGIIRCPKRCDVLFCNELFVRKCRKDCWWDVILPSGRFYWNIQDDMGHHLGRYPLYSLILSALETVHLRQPCIVQVGCQLSTFFWVGKSRTFNDSHVRKRVTVRAKRYLNATLNLR